MRHLLAIFALLGAVSLGSPAWADDKAPAPAATAVTAPAAAAAPAAAPEAAPAPVPNKGDNAWIMMSAALVILMSIPAWPCSTAAWYVPRTCCRC